MKRYTISEIRNFISCPQFGDSNYGKWGAYPLEIRETFKWLCDLYDSMDVIIKTNSKHNNFLKQENELLKEELTNLKQENELLKEELTNLKNDITRVYNTMISLETINKHELEEIEEL